MASFADIISMKKLFIIVAIYFCMPMLFVQESTQAVISYDGTGSYWMVERSDLRRYDNGKYTGLMQREVRSFVHAVKPPAKRDIQHDVFLMVAKNSGLGTWFEGSFFVDEKTLSNRRNTAMGLEGSIPASFYISPEGRLTPVVDNGFPTFRSFPAFPQEAIKPGDTWTSESVRSVDPLNMGKYTRLPMVVQYKFVGEEVYKGEDVYRITAQWATRYNQFEADPEGDENLVNAMGSHNATIIVLKRTGAAILINDRVDETFQYANGRKIQFKGSINLFTEFPPSVNTDEVLPAFEKIATVVTEESFSETDLPTTVESGKNGMIVEDTPAGLRLSVRNLQFLPNSSELVNEESSRIDLIADALLKVPEANFLIEGHSASTGNPTGEKNLSVERAYKIRQELVQRGIPAERFIVNGLGSDRPIATNDTTEGRAVNRRVEITILR